MIFFCQTTNHKSTACEDELSLDKLTIEATKKNINAAEMQHINSLTT